MGKMIVAQMALAHTNVHGCVSKVSVAEQNFSGIGSNRFGSCELDSNGLAQVRQCQ